MVSEHNATCTGAKLYCCVQSCLLVGCAILSALALSGCAGPSWIKSFSDQFFEDVPSAGHINLIAATRANGVLEITSYGRARGDAKHLVETSDLADLWIVESSWGTITFSTIPEQAAIIESMLASHDAGRNEDLGFFNVAMKDTLSSLPGISKYGVSIQVLLTLPNSGLAVRQHHIIDGTPIALSFMNVVFENGNENFTQYWGVLLMTITHELLHVEHHINGLDLDPVNFETAAELFGFCSLARFMIERSEPFEAEFQLADETPGFPGITDGVFNPQVDKFPSEYATLRGQNMSAGWIYIYANGEPLDMADPEAMDRMLRLCNHLAHDVPDFVNGETGLENLE